MLSQERFQVDGFGNTLEKQREEDNDGAFVPVWDYVYLDGVITDFNVQEGGGENGNYPDDYRQDTDNAGNVIETERRTSRTEDNPDVEENLITRTLTKNWYGHDGKLRFSQSYNSSNDFAGNSSVHDGAFQQYWYDALGRRIQVRSRQDDSTICDQGTTCESYVERVVWAGDQMIGEFRGPGDDGASGRLNVLASNGGISNPAGPVERYGKVAYTYGLGIDSPLSVVRGETVEVFPFTNGRGQYSIGADTAGAKSSLNIEWPGRLRKAFLDRDKVPGQASDKGLWVGNVVNGFADQSGLMYRRNRYYDPQTGQFTQEDPIGLGGGLNLYGFAGGDPVNLRDPFGLMPDDCEGFWGCLKAFLAFEYRGFAQGSDPTTAGLGEDEGSLGAFIGWLSLGLGTSKTFKAAKAVSSTAVVASRAGAYVDEFSRIGTVLTDNERLLELGFQGGSELAEGIFKNVPRVGEIVSTETPRGIVQSVQLADDAGTASLRHFSGRGVSTVQFNFRGGQVVKFRFATIPNWS